MSVVHTRTVPDRLVPARGFAHPRRVVHTRGVVHTRAVVHTR